MFNIIRKLNKTLSVVRLCNIRVSNHSSKSNSLYDDSNFSLDEQIRILKILNESPVEELHKFDISKSRLSKIDNWRTKRGPFKLLSDVLEVESFGISVFEKFCHSILEFETNGSETTIINGTNTTVNTSTASRKLKKSIVTPLIDHDISDNIKNAVSIHLSPAGLGWCKLQRQENFIEDWNFYDFQKLSKKLTTCNLLHLAINILHKIPYGDTYVFESPVQLSPHAKQKAMASASHLQQLELFAMFTVLLNTCPKHNPDFSFDTDSEVSLLDVPFYNRVYFLRPFLSAKLFGTFVGTEMVSVITTIERLLKIKVATKPFPCSEVKCSIDLRQFYSNQISVNKHLLGQALLEVISFMNLCVYNNPISLDAINSKKKQKM